MLDLQSQRQPESSEPKSFATPSPVKVESESTKLTVYDNARIMQLQLSNINIFNLIRQPG